MNVGGQGSLGGNPRPWPSTRYPDVGRIDAVDYENRRTDLNLVCEEAGEDQYPKATDRPVSSPDIEDSMRTLERYVALVVETIETNRAKSRLQMRSPHPTE